MFGMIARSRLSAKPILVLVAMALTHPSRANTPRDALEFSAKPVKDTVEFCETLEVEFVLKNAGDKAYWVHLPSATHGACNVDCSWGGYATGGEPWPEGLSQEEQWRKLEPGESHTFRWVRPKLGTVDVGDIAVTFIYEYYHNKALEDGLNPYIGVQKARTRYRITDSALLRELRAEDPDVARVKQGLDHVMKLAETPEYRGSQLSWFMEQRFAQDVAEPARLLSVIAADPELSEATRAWALSLIAWAQPARNESLNAEIVTLIRGLLSEDSTRIRLAAMQELAEVEPGRPRLDLILPMAEDEDVKVRQAVVHYLAQFASDEETWPHIERMIEDPSPDVRNAIASYRAIPELRARPELLIKCVLAVDDARKTDVLGNMSRWVKPGDASWMVELMKSLSPEHQVELIQAATQMPAPARTELLGQALASPHDSLRDAALALMEETLDQAYVDPLEVRVAQGSESEQKRAREILAKLNERAPFPDVKAIMAEVLSSEGDTLPPAGRGMSGAHSWRDPGAGGLFEVNDPSEIPRFRKLLDDKSPARRAAACDYLGRMRDQDSFEGIAALSQDPDPAVRRIVAEALGRLRNPKALPYLAKLAMEPDGDIADAACRSLRGLPGDEATEVLRDLFVNACREGRTRVDGDLLDGYVARKGAAAMPDLLDAFELPLSGHACSALITGLFSLSGHRIEGDFEDPEDRKRLQKEWRAWWEEHGADVNREPWEPRPVTDVQAETTYCGRKLVVEWARHRFLDNQIEIRSSSSGGGNVQPLVIPTDDEGVNGPAQYVVYRRGKPVARGDLPVVPFSRYNMIPFGNLAFGIGAGGHQSVHLELPAGDYEIQVEARRLCAEWTFKDVPGNSWGPGPTRTKAEVVTLKSNRVPLKIHEPTRMTSDCIEMLARLMGEERHERGEVELTYVSESGESFRETVTFGGLSWQASRTLEAAGLSALDSVLAYTDADAPTGPQLSYLKNIDDPRAREIVEKARASQDEKMRRHAAAPEEAKSIDELVTIATAPIGSEGWQWHESRKALVELDGKLGPEHEQYSQALIQELEGRLASKRDRHTLRGGESLWGAFRTAFFLGRIGDPAAIGVLRRTRHAGKPHGGWLDNSQCIFLRWYGAAAWKLIEVQNLPEPDRSRQLEAWVKHCLSSPDEHFMARTRLLPLLAELLGDKRQSVFRELAGSLTDPWMKCDAERWMDAAT